MPAINVDAAYTALILHKFNGVCLKECEGRSRNLSTKGVWVLMRCNMHAPVLCAKHKCPARHLAKHPSHFLSLHTTSMKTFCTRCKTNIRNYQKSWILSQRQIAELVKNYRHGITTTQALHHITVPDNWLGKIVGMVKLGPGVSTSKLTLDVLRSRTLATPFYLNKFNFTHSLQSAILFNSPVTFLNKKKPGLWKAHIDLQDLPLDSLTSEDRDEIMQYMIA